MTGVFDLAALKRRLAEAPDGAGLRPIGLQDVHVGAGALESLPDVVASLVPSGEHHGPVAVLSDLTPKRYCSGELLEYATKAIASAAGVRGVFVGTAGHNVHADEATIARATEDTEGASCIVAVGSGTVADIGKVLAASHHGLPYVIVQTADSVNGFADDRSVLLVNGVKRTVPSTWANVLVADTDVLVDAPVEMNASGFADLIAMFTAPADWYLANLLGMDDSYSPTVVALAREQGPALLQAARLIPGADSVGARPDCSHLDLERASPWVSPARPHPARAWSTPSAICSRWPRSKLATRQLCTASRSGRAALSPPLSGEGSSTRSPTGASRGSSVPDPVESEMAVRAAFFGVDPSGEMAAECWRDYEASLRVGHGRLSGSRSRPQQWPLHERALRHLLVGRRRRSSTALRSAGAPVSFAELTPSVPDEAARWAVAKLQSHARAVLGSRPGELSRHLERGPRRQPPPRGERPRSCTVSELRCAGPSRRPKRIYPGYVFDLDGTVYLGDSLLPHAAETIDELRGRGSQGRLCDQQAARDGATTMPASSPASGCRRTRSDVVTSVDALVDYLEREHPGAVALAVAESSAIDELDGGGLQDDRWIPPQAQVVVVSFDRTFDYEKLNAAFQAVRYGGATHRRHQPRSLLSDARGRYPRLRSHAGRDRGLLGRRPPRPLWASRASTWRVPCWAASACRPRTSR